MFNLIARRIDRIRVRATLKSPTNGQTVESPLDKLNMEPETSSPRAIAAAIRVSVVPRSTGRRQDATARPVRP